MAALLPPPKRQKTYHGVPEPIPEPVQSTVNILVQFVSEDDGMPMAPAVSLPANVSRDGLETLVNRLKSQNSMKDDEDEDDGPMPFAFHVALPSGSDQSNPTRLAITKNIEDDIMAHPSNPYTEEDIFVVLCSPQSVFRVRPATRCSSTLSGHSSPILCASFSPTGEYLATGSGDCTARLWDLNTELPSHTLVGHKGWVLCVEWEAMGRKVATGGHDGQVRLWDPKAGKALGDAMKGHTKWITSLSWEPIHLNATSPRLASSSKDGTVRVWNTGTRTLQFALGGHTASVNVVKWSGSSFIYTGSSDRTVRVWDSSNGKCLYTLKDHAHWVTTLALNTDFTLRTGPYDHTGKKPADEEEAKAWAQKKYDKVMAANNEVLISGSDDHTLFMWSLSSSPAEAGSKKKPVARLTGHQRQISHVAFSPDGRWIASGSWDTSVRVWDGRTGKFVATLRGHVGAVYRLTWSADSRLLVSASKDATVKIWNLKTYKIKTDLPGHTDEVYCVDFVADKIVSGGRDKTLKIWKN